MALNYQIKNLNWDYLKHSAVLNIRATLNGLHRHSYDGDITFDMYLDTDKIESIKYYNDFSDEFNRMLDLYNMIKDHSADINKFLILNKGSFRNQFCNWIIDYLLKDGNIYVV